MSKKKIAIGCDEAAYALKIVLKDHLEKLGYEAKDFGAEKGEVVLYPDVAAKVAKAVAAGEFERAVLTCGTGIGMAITANKIPGVRAAVCHDPFSAERARKSNNAQIAKSLLNTWLESEFSGGGSAPKVQRICDYEEEYFKK